MKFQLTRPRKARLHLLLFFVLNMIFQLTRPRKARPNELNSICISSKFQLTRPRKARQGLDFVWLFVPNFNSRAHARRDKELLTVERSKEYFNSRAHARRDPDGP